MTITDLIATLRQYAADRVGATPTPKYTDSDLRRVIARAIGMLPQLQQPKDGSYIRVRDHVAVFFDASEALTNPVNATIDGHLRLTNTALVGSVDRVVTAAELRGEFSDLLFIYAEPKYSGGAALISIDISLDGGVTFLLAGGFEAALALNEYVDVSSYAKKGVTVRFKLAVGTAVIDSAQLYFLFLKQAFLLDYAASIEWAACAIIDGDLLHEAQAKGYDLTVINSLAMSRESNLRRATGKATVGEPLEQPQSAEPGRGMKFSQLGGQGRAGTTDRRDVEGTDYGRSVARVFK